ncbi:hypothetical protein HRV97_01885 [Sphingomonas sp. HHU CXW]|uniref:DUF4105 domain-containing protein n=1 Tax=Sphingomonas hominis TaxID=2741495 RepID=A0ABX2JGZ0_9SPHN|nr:hypothetical protein [Sphingomonas hominis]NTS63911.1 hypothetical protein [Sphingomonas hominis]
MTLFNRLAGAIGAMLLLVTALPAQAAVTITFWNRDFGNYFPHAFFMLRGAPDRGGPAVDASYGFTAQSVTPALLFGNVKGRVETPKLNYMNGSHVRFAVTLTDAQYDAVLRLIAGWSEKTGDSTYNLGKRNCVHFVREAARASGLDGLDHPKLMKKPSSFLLAVENANVGHVSVIDKVGKDYLATLPQIDGVRPIDAPVSDPGTMKGKKPDTE